MKAEDIMTRNVITVREDVTLEDVAEIFEKNHISGVPVVNKDNQVIGLISKNDLISQHKKISRSEACTLLEIMLYYQSKDLYEKEIKKFFQVKVREVMSVNVKCAAPSTPVGEVAEIMLKNGFNRVPVVSKNKRIIGIIARADIIKAIHNFREM